MDVLKHFGASEDYETIKNTLKSYANELQALRSRPLSPEERKHFQDKYKRILCLTEVKNISIKEYGKLQMAIKKFRKKFEHLGFFDYAGPCTTASTCTMTESYLENKRYHFRPFRQKYEGTEEPDGQNYDQDDFTYSDEYFIMVSQLENVITCIENSESFSPSDRRIYELRFETIRETIDERDFSEREYQNLIDMYEEYLGRFERAMERYERKCQGSRNRTVNKTRTRRKETRIKTRENTPDSRMVVKLNSHTRGRSVSQTRNSMSERTFSDEYHCCGAIQSKISKSERTFCDESHPRFSISSETFCETVIKITDLTVNCMSFPQKLSYVDPKLSFRNFPNEIDNIFDNVRQRGIYGFLSYNEFVTPRGREKYIVQHSISFQGFPREICELEQLHDLKLSSIMPRLKNRGNQCSVEELRLKRKALSEGSVSQNSSVEEETVEARRRYRANLKIIYYKRLQKLCEDSLSEERGSVRSCSNEEISKDIIKKDLAIKPTVKLLSAIYNETLRKLKLTEHEKSVGYKTFLKLEYFPKDRDKTDGETIKGSRRKKEKSEDNKYEFGPEINLQSGKTILSKKNPHYYDYDQIEGRLMKHYEKEKKSYLSSDLHKEHNPDRGHTKKVSFTVDQSDVKEKGSLYDLEVHPFTINDEFDLDSVDALRKDKEKIDALEGFAKTCTDKVNHFRNCRDSLEYYILDQDLKRMLEKLTKIKCRRDRKTTKKKVDLIKYLKKLYMVLDERSQEKS